MPKYVSWFLIAQQETIPFFFTQGYLMTSSWDSTRLECILQHPQLQTTQALDFHEKVLK